MPSYAAIRLTKETIISVLAAVNNERAEKERFLWGMLNYPYQPGVKHYYIGGNYLGLNWVDYSRQILTQTEFDLLFTYAEHKKINGRPDPSLNWFPAKLRENLSPNMIIG